MSDAISKDLDRLEDMVASGEIGCFALFTRMAQLVRSAQALQSGEPVAAIKGWFHGECVVQALDPSLALPTGMALYAAPQRVVDVNQQLIEALKKAESHLHAMMAHIDHKPQRFQEHCWQQVLDIRAAIAAAQEQSK